MENKGKTEEKFSELCKDLSQQAIQGIVNHRLYIELATGELDMDKFKEFIQQDHIYMLDFYQAYKMAAEKEVDPELKAILVRYSQGASTLKLLNSYYEEFGFGPSGVPTTGTSNYTNTLLMTAKNESPAVLFAAMYPCTYVWTKIGREMGKISADTIEDNPYKRFVQVFSSGPTDTEDSYLAKASRVIDTYWMKNEGDEEIREKMVKAFETSVRCEFEFADAVLPNSQ